MFIVKQLYFHFIVTKQKQNISVTRVLKYKIVISLTTKFTRPIYRKSENITKKHFKVKCWKITIFHENPKDLKSSNQF